MQKVPSTDKTIWLKADWPAPAGINAGITTRRCGISTGPYSRFNLAAHVGDDSHSVVQNRSVLCEKLALESEPIWLNQVHGNRIIRADTANDRTADGSYTDRQNVVCTVLTADCIPLLICNRSGTEIAAIHIGWRGFCSDIVPMAVDVFRSKADELLAWIGPHISAENYEVDDQVRDRCLTVAGNAQHAFVSSSPGHWLASLEKLVRTALERQGVKDIYSSGCCTYAESDSFFSYRRDGVTGRMAALIWIDTL